MSQAAELRSMLIAELHVESQFAGKKSAVASIARRYEMKPRRVMAVIYGEVDRIWADEMDRARQVYRRFFERQRERFEAEIEKLAAERARLDAQDARDGVT